ncbi:hypothetical protein ABZT06_07865 [Streptomyces sp. NPDC005483]
MLATSMVAPHLLRSALLHVDTPLVQQAPAESAWAKKQLGRA